MKEKFLNRDRSIDKNQYGLKECNRKVIKRGSKERERESKRERK